MKIDTPGDPGPIDPPSSPDRPADKNYASIPFALDGDDSRFAPDVYPETLRVTKERSLNRRDNFCGGEDVTDQGPKNKEIHISGYLKEERKDDIWNISDYAQKLDLTSPTWSGEVRVETAELDGPLGLNPESQQRYWKYTLDLVSTGKDEPGGPTEEDGIISDGQ